MTKPCGLLLSTGGVEPEQVSDVLSEQGGPAWDRTVFRQLASVDVRSLVVGEPAAGEGTGISLASSGWWLRHADDFADRLSAASGQPILAVISADGVSGYHLAQPDGSSQRQLVLEGTDAWVAGVGLLLGEDLGDATPAALGDIAREVHGDDPVGAGLPGMFNFSLTDPEELDAIVRFRGEALQGGCPWRPGTERDPGEAVPSTMRGLILATAVRLPGPPRWARATRAHAIRRAEQVIREDGWLCLVPQVDGKLADYGTAVRILQIAPLADGSALGVIHPRAAVKVVSVEGSTVQVEVLDETTAADPEAMAADVELALELLPAVDRPLTWSEDELRASEDPARLLGWKLVVSPDQCQRYLAEQDAGGRMAILVEALRDTVSGAKEQAEAE